MNSSNFIGLSLGTCNTYIYKRSKGIVLGEPSAVACDAYDEDKIIAMGYRAKKMRGRTPDTIKLVFPVNKGVIADFKKTVIMLNAYIERVKRNRWGLDVFIAVPSSATAVERRAASDAVVAAGASKATIVDSAIAAALGCDLDIFDEKGQMIIDIGAGNTGISVLSFGGVAYSIKSDICSSTFDNDIINYLRKNNRILIGAETAEDIKIKLGSVISDGTMDFMTVSGRDILRGLPVESVISSDDVRAALQNSVNGIVDSVLYVLEHIAPELSSDIVKNKIHLTGGGSLLRGWEALILKKTGINAMVAENPLECCAIGAGKANGLMRRIKNNIYV